MAELDNQFWGAVINAKSVEAYLKLGTTAHLFEGVASAKPLHQFIDGFVRDHGALPQLATVNEELDTNIEAAPEPPSYYYDKLVARYIRRQLITLSKEAAEKLEGGSPQEALDTLSEGCLAISANNKSNMIYDFRSAHDIVMPELAAKATEGYSLTLGWPTFDNMNGGLRGGDLVSVVGRPGLGKTMQMLSRAYRIWYTQKRTVLFVSMEMKPILIFERLAALHAKVPHQWVKDGSLPTLHSTVKQNFTDKLLALNSEDSGLYVVDGKLSATADDIRSLCAQYRPAVVFVDGAYMLQHNDRLNIYERVGVNTNLLKQAIAEEFSIPVLASWQFNREGTKLKKGEQPGLEHVGYSDVIGQVSSVVMGLFQPESVETLKRRRIDILKGRSGETGGFDTNWDWKAMDFEELTGDEELGEIDII